MHRAQMASLTQIELLLPELRAYATTICAGQEQDAEDLVQDAIERTLRSDTRPTKLDELRPWVIRVIRNLHFDELRKRRVRRNYSASEKHVGADGLHHRHMDRDILVRLAFEKLPAAAREILYLVDILEFKYADAAWVLGVPKGTVMSRVSRARKALLTMVEGEASLTDAEEYEERGRVKR